MTLVKAELKNLRQSPRKVRLIADLIRGKSLSDAQASLSFAVKKAADPFLKLLNSAVANARSQNLSVDDLKVKEVRVDGGAVLKRFRPVAFGRSHPIRKRTSHIKIVLTTDNLQQTKETKQSNGVVGSKS